MNVPKPTALRAAACALAAVLPGCVSHTHSVGLGGTGTAVTSSRQFYLFFGLVPINTVETQRLASDLTSYTIDTRFGLVDLLLAPFLLPVTLTTRTVVVRT